jgi:hypothetical protein
MLVFRKTWHVHTEYRDVRVNFLFRIFLHLKIFFLVVQAYDPMFKKIIFGSF